MSPLESGVLSRQDSCETFKGGIESLHCTLDVKTFNFYRQFLANVQRIQRGPKFLELRSRNWKASRAQIKGGLFPSIKICYKLVKLKFTIKPKRRWFEHTQFSASPGIFLPKLCTSHHSRDVP